MYIYSIYAHYGQSPYSEMEGSLRLESKLTVTRQVVEIATRAIFIFFTRIMIVRWLLNEVCINTMGQPYFSTGEQLEYLQNKDAICMTKTTQVPVWMWCIHTYRRHIDAVLYWWDASRMGLHGWMDVYIIDSWVVYHTDALWMEWYGWMCM